MRKRLLREAGCTRQFCLSFLLLAGAVHAVAAQTSQTPQPPDTSPAAPAQEALPPPQGQVIIQSHGTPPPLPDTGTGVGTGTDANATQAPAPAQPIADQNVKADLTDADRSAPLITSYDLDVRLRPADAGLSARAQLTVRNTGSLPLKQLALQISSSLRWESAALLTPNQRLNLPVAQHRLDTDADHTGAETELILNLPEPLAPGASAKLDLFYSGGVPASAARLQRMGASAAQQRSTDWDAISPAWTGLRGFGNVLWYPVATPQLFLAEGNTLFQAVGRTRLREQDASVRLRLGVEYMGEAPVAAYFCGHRQTLTAVTDSPNSPTESGSGVATATFGAEALGFRVLNLFLLQQPEVYADPPGTDASAAVTASTSSKTESSAPPVMAAPQAPPAADSSSSSSSLQNQTDTDTAPPPLLRREGGLAPEARPFLALEGADPGTIRQFSAASYRSSAILRQWLGPQPLSTLTAVDHDGQPFQDGPLLIAPLPVLSQVDESSALVQSLTHAWVQTGQPWMDDGLPQFFALLVEESQSGRETAIAQLDELMKPVALTEPDPTAKPTGSPTSPGPSQPPAGQAEPLITASSDLIYRRKAAAVWWMLRGIVGDGNLHAALSAWCTQPVSTEPPMAQALGFEHLLEKVSNQELGWFFNDWVLQDKGLPDLTIGDVAVVEEPTGPGHPAGWLVAVTIRNEGGAVADVPLVVRSGLLSNSRRVRIAGQSSHTERVLVEGAPTLVILNDGSTPEERVSTHTSDVHVRTQ